MSAVNQAGFFQYHGVWAFGVRLFRNLQFGSKAALISIAFMVPMIGLMVWLLMDGSEASRQERMDGTRQHVEVAYSVLQWAHEQERSGAMTRAQAQDTAVRAV